MKDLEVRGLEIIANTPKGHAFLKMQVVPWDPPCRSGPSEWFIVLLPVAIAEVLEKAVLAGLSVEGWSRGL